jgi:protein disulfide-isomerase A6
LYAIPASNPISHILRTALGLAKGSTVEVIALNARRGWWRHFNAAEEDFGTVAVESWVDAIRLGEGTKEKLPDALVVGAEAETAEAEPVVETETETAPEPEAEAEAEPEVEAEAKPEQAEPEAEDKPEHDEL